MEERDEVDSRDEEASGCLVWLLVGLLVFGIGAVAAIYYLVYFLNNNPGFHI